MNQQNRRNRHVEHPRGFRYGDLKADEGAYRLFGESLCDARGQVFLWAFLLAELTQLAATANAAAQRGMREKMEFTWEHFPQDIEREQAALAMWKPVQVSATSKRIAVSMSRGEWPNEVQYLVEFALDDALDIQVRETGFGSASVTKPILRKPSSFEDARKIAHDYARVAVAKFDPLMPSPVQPECGGSARA